MEQTEVLEAKVIEANQPKTRTTEIYYVCIAISKGMLSHSETSLGKEEAEVSGPCLVWWAPDSKRILKGFCFDIEKRNNETIGT